MTIPPLLSHTTSVIEVSALGRRGLRIGRVVDVSDVHFMTDYDEAQVVCQNNEW